MTPEQTVLAAGYKAVTRAEFEAATDVPAGMRKVGAGVIAQWGGDFVVYDPAGGDDGWVIIDDDRDQIIAETVEHLNSSLEPEPLATPPDPDQPSLF